MGLRQQNKKERNSSRLHLTNISLEMVSSKVYIQAKKNKIKNQSRVSLFTWVQLQVLGPLQTWHSNPDRMITDLFVWPALLYNVSVLSFTIVSSQLPFPKQLYISFIVVNCVRHIVRHVLNIWIVQFTLVKIALVWLSLLLTIKW